MPSDQSRMMGQANFTYSPLEKTLEKQIETIEDQGTKQINLNKNQWTKIMNKNERQAALSNKKILKVLVKKELLI